MQASNKVEIHQLKINTIDHNLINLTNNFATLKKFRYLKISVHVSILQLFAMRFNLINDYFCFKNLIVYFFIDVADEIKPHCK